VYLLVFSRIFLLGILIFKGLTARRLYKSFGVKGLTVTVGITLFIKTFTIFDFIILFFIAQF
jgi:hypothetical protein